MIKVQINYDMRAGKEQECQEYLVSTLAPGLAKLGFQFSEVWLTLWGKSPQIISGGEVVDLDQARAIFLSSDWQNLANGMRDLTDDFQLKLMRSNSQN